MKLYFPFIREQLKKNKEKFQEKSLYAELEIEPLVIIKKEKDNKEESSVIIIDIL